MDRGRSAYNRNMYFTPPALTGLYVRLEPLVQAHAEGLYRVMQDEDVCRYLFWRPPQSIGETEVLIRKLKRSPNAA